MSKQPVAPQAGGEPPSRARTTNTAPSRAAAAAAQSPARHRNASVQRERQGVAGAPRDGAPIRAVRPVRRVDSDSTDEEAQPQDATPSKPPPRPKPRYVRPSQGAWKLPDATPSKPGEPPGGSRDPDTAAPIERVSTLDKVDGTGAPLAQQPTTPPGSTLHRRQSPRIPPKLRKRQPMAFCFTACCILFWLLVIAVGVAVLVVYLIYRPQPPRLRVTSATLNAGYIDELGGGGMALNSDLTVLAAISNPNTVIHIVLYYMQLDLYFRGSLIGTQAVWPTPLHEGPGDSVLRDVHLVMSEVAMTKEDVMVWQNATAKRGLVALHLYGRFHTQLNFGRWLPFKYWVHPRCTLWLDPPPSGALRRARC